MPAGRFVSMAGVGQVRHRMLVDVAVMRRVGMAIVNIIDMASSKRVNSSCAVTRRTSLAACRSTRCR
jgi:ribosomal protein S7